MYAAKWENSYIPNFSPRAKFRIQYEETADEPIMPSAHVVRYYVLLLLCYHCYGE